MAVQKSKVTRSRRGQRRSHDSLTATTLSTDPTTGEVHRRHRLLHAPPFRAPLALAGFRRLARAGRLRRNRADHPLRGAVLLLPGQGGRLVMGGAQGCRDRLVAPFRSTVS